MGAPIAITRLDKSAQELRVESGKSQNGRVSRRLLALAMVLDGVSRKLAAERCGMDRQTLCDWVHRYNIEGIKGLYDRGNRGRKARLNGDQMAQLASWIEVGPDPEHDGVVRWRRIDLVRKIKAEFELVVCERTISDYLARLGYVRLTVRPEHPKTSIEAQETFKKTSPKL